MGERISQVLDLNLTTPTLAGNRAAYVLRAAETRERRDEVTVFGLNCGQEVYDVTLTDAQAGLSVANRRVLGLTWRYLTSPAAVLPLRHDSLPRQPVRRLSMDMRRGVLRAFDSGTYKASVEIAGSIAVWLTGVPVARNIAAADPRHRPQRRRPLLRPCQPQRRRPRRRLDLSQYMRPRRGERSR